MDNKELEVLLKEHDDLGELKSSYDFFIDRIRAEQNLIKNIMENVYYWKTGEGKKAFLSELEDYNYQYTMKIIQLESTYHDIGQAQKNIRSKINTKLSNGPKF
ncbi:hypothetical protein GJU41_10165 [Bacillus idriensis]|uniref:Uncharacterized protein n=1 Tax=Metabacillus idriensis TaxID=324768 RepID=A0A6I2M899_9BACI|nr:hypothetical protein [Metabacillus idriensis]MRX54338.1 hypothetical protein [Metabacillus idriensis]